MTELGEKTIAAAAKAYGVDKKYIKASSFDEVTKTATIVTHGGKKVRYQDGDKVEPLDQISVTGINPIKRKAIAGKEKK